MGTSDDPVELLSSSEEDEKGTPTRRDQAENIGEEAEAQGEFEAEKQWDPDRDGELGDLDEEMNDQDADGEEDAPAEDDVDQPGTYPESIASFRYPSSPRSTHSAPREETNEAEIIDVDAGMSLLLIVPRRRVD
jgi:hypothetical protein